MLASGEVYGKDQPIALSLLGSERSYTALEGVAMVGSIPICKQACIVKHQVLSDTRIDS